MDWTWATPPKIKLTSLHHDQETRFNKNNPWKDQRLVTSSWCKRNQLLKTDRDVCTCSTQKNHRYSSRCWEGHHHGKAPCLLGIAGIFTPNANAACTDHAVHRPTHCWNVTSTDVTPLGLISHCFVRDSFSCPCRYAKEGWCEKPWKIYHGHPLASPLPYVPNKFAPGFKTAKQKVRRKRKLNSTFFYFCSKVQFYFQQKMSLWFVFVNKEIKPFCHAITHNEKDVHILRFESWATLAKSESCTSRDPEIALAFECHRGVITFTNKYASSA